MLDSDPIPILGCKSRLLFWWIPRCAGCLSMAVAVRPGKRELWRFLREAKIGRRKLREGNEVGEMNGNEGKAREGKEGEFWKSVIPENARSVLILCGGMDPEVCCRRHCCSCSRRRCSSRRRRRRRRRHCWLARNTCRRCPCEPTPRCMNAKSRGPKCRAGQDGCEAFHHSRLGCLRHHRCTRCPMALTNPFPGIKIADKSTSGRQAGPDIWARACSRD